MAAKGEVTRILQRVESGDQNAVSDLLPMVYAELRQLAASYMQRERPDHTLQPTALVHEAYLKLVDQTRVNWKGRGHFFSVAAQQMRRLLVDHYRHHGREKRGGDRVKHPLREEEAVVGNREIDLIALDEALEELAKFDPERARIVELRYFGGLSNREIAAMLGVSQRTIDRGWDLARRWLFVQVHKGDTQEGGG